MRQYKLMLRAFIGAAALTLAGCEEQSPPPTRTTISAPSTAAAKPEVRAAAAPTVTPPVAPAKVEAATPAVASDEVDADSKVDEVVAAARKAIAANDLDRGLALARLATKKAPNRSSAWNTLGRAQLKRGARQDALASFARAVELNPSSSYAQNNLGLTLIYDGQYAEAVDALEEATQLEPVEGYMWNNLGMAYEHLDRLDEARAAYQQAIELKAARAKDNFARLDGVKSIETAKAEYPPVDMK
jgi:Flp pilus assembly protein TadD